MAILVRYALFFPALFSVVAGSIFTDCPLAFGNCSSDWIGYQFYDRENREYGQYVEVTAAGNNLTEAGFDWKKPVTVIIPGYAETTHRFELAALKRDNNDANYIGDIHLPLPF
ncbi:unnamed protein product [Nezara viridula]|uniref:Neuropeptide n=1 Tax=Nezara viridula TaxID=85310 RepID=A0A9P0HV75_NEZVI|nr:unnamed protein product [Nezara viridula]